MRIHVHTHAYTSSYNAPAASPGCGLPSGAPAAPCRGGVARKAWAAPTRTKPGIGPSTAVTSCFDAVGIVEHSR